MKSKTQNQKPKIVIVGAGPAGASLAIRLARDDFDATLIEREKFPRQKLCGEFISPECLEHFRQLGVLDEMFSAGGERIGETVFYAPNGRSVSFPSKWLDSGQSALSLSRAEMDFRLLQRAKACGVEVLEESKVVGLLFEGNVVSGVKARDKARKLTEIPADLVIDATGRARALSKSAEKTFSAKNKHSKTRTEKLIGFKTHLENVKMEKNRCEIYFFRGGYGGLSYIENGLANLCFLIKAEAAKEFIGNTNKIVEKIIFQNRRAFETLKDAQPVYDWMAVSVDGFGEKDLNPLPNLFTVGDAAAFIDPFTGSGMLMALESAELLAEAIRENCAAPEAISENYKILHRRKFWKRFRVCSLMRRLAFIPSLAAMTIAVLSLSEKSRASLARATRPNVLNTNK